MSESLTEWVDKVGLSANLKSAVLDACDTLDDLLLADQDDLEIVSVSLQPQAPLFTRPRSLVRNLRTHDLRARAGSRFWT